MKRFLNNWFTEPVFLKPVYAQITILKMKKNTFKLVACLFCNFFCKPEKNLVFKDIGLVHFFQFRFGFSVVVDPLWVRPLYTKLVNPIINIKGKSWAGSENARVALQFDPPMQAAFGVVILFITNKLAIGNNLFINNNSVTLCYTPNSSRKCKWRLMSSFGLLISSQ